MSVQTRKRAAQSDQTNQAKRTKPDPPPAPPSITTVFHKLIEYSIKLDSKNAEIKLNPCTEQELNQLNDVIKKATVVDGLADDLRTIYSIHRNALQDHHNLIGTNDILPTYDQLLKGIRTQTIVRKAADKPYHAVEYGYGDHAKMLYHASIGCILEYSLESEFEYAPRVIWLSAYHALLSVLHCIDTFAPYWWDGKQYESSHRAQHEQWEAKQKEYHANKHGGKAFMKAVGVLHPETTNYTSLDDEWRDVISSFNPTDNRYIVNEVAMNWIREHPVVDTACWDKKRAHDVGLRVAKKCLLLKMPDE